MSVPDLQRDLVNPHQDHNNSYKASFWADLSPLRSRSEDLSDACAKLPGRKGFSDSSSVLSSEHFPGTLDDDEVDRISLDFDVNTSSYPRSGDELQRHLMSAVWDSFAADPQHKLSRNGTATPYMRAYAAGRRAVLHSTSSFDGDLKVGCVQKVPGLARPISLRALHNRSACAGISIQ